MRGVTRRTDHEIAVSGEPSVRGCRPAGSSASDSDAIATRCRRGGCIECTAACTRSGHLGLGQEARWLAAVLACGDGAVLSHRSAATFWGIRLGELFKAEVTTGHDRRHAGDHDAPRKARCGGPHHPPRHPGHQPRPHAGRPRARPGPRRADASAQRGDVPPPVRPEGDRGRADPPPVQGAEGPADRGLGDAVDDGGPLPDDLHAPPPARPRHPAPHRRQALRLRVAAAAASSWRPTPGSRTPTRSPSRPTAARPTPCSSPAGWSCASPGPTSHDAAGRQPPTVSQALTR